MPPFSLVHRHTHVMSMTLRWILHGLCGLLCVLSLGVHAAEDPTSTRVILNAGAVELALARVDAFQPGNIDAPRWAEWEGLRCEILARLNRHAELLTRIGKLSPEPLAPALGVCFVLAAQAAVALNNPHAARAHAARVLWQRNPSSAEVRAVRLAVIESYVTERRGEDAFRSMLRFAQDYQPLDRAIAERFAEALLDLGLDRDALNWLNRTDQTSPTLLRLQMRGGALAPEMVITQARAALARTPDPGYWRVIDEAAQRTRNVTLQVEALERWLQALDTRNEVAVSESAQRLWKTYLSAAADLANREQLLMGDDRGWSDHAARRQGSDPLASRALYGYLAQRAQDAGMRRDAQLQLVSSLSSAGLDRVAVRMMQTSGADVGALDAHTRYLLGTLAAKRGDATRALQFWNGLTTPAGVDATNWQRMLAQTTLQAGDAAGSAAIARRLVEGRTTVAPELAANLLELAQEMLEMRALDAAQAVYELVAPIASDARAREAFFGLGRVHELKGDATAAATFFLRSALLVQAAAPDALAFQSRLLAALNLMRAGLRDDARAQFEWLIKNSKDAALTEAARRGLARL